jgi:hypothetical protein
MIATLLIVVGTIVIAIIGCALLELPVKDRHDLTLLGSDDEGTTTPGG